MERLSDKKKCMASLAVFRQLYTEQKDIYAVIAEFIKQSIIERGVVNFELQEMKQFLMQDCGFELPSAVIKSALKRIKFIQKNGGTSYTITEELDEKQVEDFKTLSLEANTTNDLIISALTAFVGEKKGVELNEIEKEKLKKSFCAYIIDELTNIDYSEFISAFLIANRSNVDFISQLNRIKQGVIIYIGLTFNTNFQVIDTMDVPFHIYLEMEVLFHMAGYNGTLFQSLFDEFYEQVEQINKQNRKPVIFLHYFSETENEVNAYFHMAEQIIRRKTILDPSKQAMTSLVKGCSEAYQIQEKKTLFYRLLKEKHITLDSQERYYDRGDVKYNIEHEKFFENKEDGISDEDVDRKLRLLNYISIKRGSKNQSILRNIGHILLSSNSLTFRIAFDSDVRDERTVPLATSLDFLTNRFWLSLNKGLKSDMNLHSFDIITKAQIVMSSRVNASIAKLFKELEDEDKAGKFDQQQKLAILAGLHKNVANPEDIVSENEDTYLNVISMEDVSQFNAERIIEREQFQKEKNKYQQIIHDKEDEHEETKEKLIKAAKFILDQRSSELNADYQKQTIVYDGKKDRWVNGKYKEKEKKSILIVSLYIIVIALFYLASVGFFKSAIASILGLLAFTIPFFRPLINHWPIKESFVFLLCKEKMRQYRDELQIQFEESHPKPQLMQLTLDDILAELSAKTI